MHRYLLLAVVSFALAGCGVAVTKPDPKQDEKPTPAVVEPAEVYDKVAPMPREVKTPPRSGGVGDDKDN